MEKTAFEQMDGTYRQEGDYFLPNLTAPESTPVGIWGQRRKRYLREHRGPLYTALLLSRKLDSHLSEIDAQAEAVFFQLVKQIAKQEGVTEQFKDDNQMEWVGLVTLVRDRVTEMVNDGLIFD